MKQIFLLALLFFSFSQMLNAQEWEEVSDVPFLKHHSNGFGLNGKAYIIEGINNANENSQEVWEYDPDSDTWTQLNDFPGEGRGVAIGDDWNGKYYYGFGFRDTGNFDFKYLNDLWEFDPIAGTFTQLPSCPCPGRSHPAFSAHNGKIHMGTGSSANGDLNDWWEYDMATQVWTEKVDMPGGNRHHPFFFAMDEYIYVGGGHRFNWMRYDPATETWSDIDNYPEGRVAGTQFSYDGKGYVLGGDDWEHVHVANAFTFMRYDPLIDEWETLEPLPNGSRWAPSSFIIGDTLYFFGGLSDFIQGDRSMWRFDLSTLDEEPPVSTNELNLEVEVYPNPFMDHISIRSAVNAIDAYQVQVTDVNGVVVWQQADFYANQSEIDLSFLPAGVYFLRLEKEGQFGHVKMMKTN